MEQPSPLASPPRPKVRKVFWWLLGGAGIALVICAIFLFLRPAPADSTPAVTEVSETPSTEVPEFTVATVVAGLDRPWDVAVLPNGAGVVTQRGGSLSSFKDGVLKQITRIDDVVAHGEGGLMGLAVDPQFTTNRLLYTCYNTTSDIRIVRFKVDEPLTQLTEKQPIVTGLPSSPGGRHSGCRLAFGPDGYLWIGTGDSAKGSTPQDPKSLGGKILRVDRDGRGAPGNLEAPFDGRIYSYGHRNTQGIAFLEAPRGGVIGYSAEHGSTIDDEINPLTKGNFGWDPDAGYTERNIPMTDTKKFPDAIEAVWRSGTPTQAPSGLTEIRGKQWQAWNGALVMAMLKAKHLKILQLDDTGKIIGEQTIVTDRGRLRDVERTSDGSLYVTTDNGQGKDEVLLLSPRQTP